MDVVQVDRADPVVLRAVVKLRRVKLHKAEVKRQHDRRDLVVRAVAPAVVPEVRVVAAASTSTTCSSDCLRFRWPMLRSATPSSFPVRRASIRPA